MANRKYSPEQAQVLTTAALRKHGKLKTGRPPKATSTAEAIRVCLQYGLTPKEIAQELSVHVQHVWLVRRQLNRGVNPANMPTVAPRAAAQVLAPVEAPRKVDKVDREHEALLERLQGVMVAEARRAHAQGKITAEMAADARARLRYGGVHVSDNPAGWSDAVWLQLHDLMLDPRQRRNPRAWRLIC
jgi:hypothetical protein